MSEYIQHFREEEKELIAQVEKWIAQVQERYGPLLTHFLNPREASIVYSLVAPVSEIEVSFEGGFEQAERKRACIYPSYFQPEKKDFQIGTVTVHYPSKFATISHWQLLGSVTALGIRRDVIGDMITDGNQWQFFYDCTLSTYIHQQLTHVGKTKVTLEETDAVLVPQDDWQHDMIIVSSLRIDAVIAACFHLSRHKTKEYCQMQRVQLNFAIEQRPDTHIEESDILSIRGLGRIRILQIEGRTKKDKIRISVAIISKRNTKK